VGKQREGVSGITLSNNLPILNRPPASLLYHLPRAVRALLGHAAPVLPSQDAVHPPAQHADLALHMGRMKGEAWMVE